MSLELHAFIHKSPVPGREQWQAAIDPLGFDCKIDCDYAPFEFSGFLPFKLNGELSCFEIYFDSAADLVAMYPNEELDGRDFAVSFRWGNRLEEGVCVCIAAAALAKSFDAVVYDPQSSGFCTDEGLLGDARSLIENPPMLSPAKTTFWQRLRRFGRG